MSRIVKRWYHRPFRWWGSTRLGAWMNKGVLQRLDQWLMRKTDGRRSVSSTLTGLPVVRITAIGAKSGKARTLPLLAVPEGERQYLLIASNFGRRKNPAWYHNMRKNPQVTLSDADGERPFIAREVFGEERDRYWRQAASYYPGYDQYARWTSRTIPVLVLDPHTPETETDDASPDSTDEAAPTSAPTTPAD